MSHPHTASHAGFRKFAGSSYGELQHTGWEFDGTLEDVRSFAAENLGEVERVKDCGGGTFDVLLENGDDYRVYTEAD